MMAVLIGVAVTSLSIMAQAAPDMAVLPAEMRGVVMRPDGETPLDGLRVRVWDATNEKVVYRTRTDENGVFAIPLLTEGNHYVTVGPVRIDMQILTARGGITPQPHGIVVVVPHRAPILPGLLPGTAGAALVPLVMSP